MTPTHKLVQKWRQRAFELLPDQLTEAVNKLFDEMEDDISRAMIAAPLTPDERERVVKVLTPADLPSPDTIIEYPSGARTALMFHYATEEIPFADIAAAHGFEVTFATLDEDDPLFAEYEAGEDITAKWKPEVPDGWQYGCVEDGEDGPFACFIRPLLADLTKEAKA